MESGLFVTTTDNTLSVNQTQAPTQPSSWLIQKGAFLIFFLLIKKEKLSLSLYKSFSLGGTQDREEIQAERELTGVPRVPLAPFSPASPGWPMSPLVPTSPASPRGPLSPWKNTKCHLGMRNGNMCSLKAKSQHSALSDSRKYPFLLQQQIGLLRLKSLYFFLRNRVNNLLFDQNDGLGSWTKMTQCLWLCLLLPAV